MKAPTATEAQIQQTVFDFIGYSCPDVIAFAVPNGAKRSVGGRAANAVPGLTKGVCDIVILAEGGQAYLIEMKRTKPRGRLSEDQIKFLKRLTNKNVPHTVAYSLDDAVAFLQLHRLTQATRTRKL